MTSRTPEQIAQTKSQLLALIDELAVVRGRVTLSSGKEADYYLDLRRITLDHRSAPLVGDVMLDLFEEHGLLNDLDAAGGLTMGADPVGTAIMHASVQRNTPVDAFVVRKQAKEHGMGRRVEGPDVKGKRVIAVEDTSTTGGSVLTAVEALREAGANVVAVAVVMDRETGAKERVEAEGLPYLIALSTADLGLE
ncbi:orotate phosphoribosyltransferase [Brevibacterium sp. UMB1308A]|uniref:orotate phosphoribosyltransferase n=1 Tax=Brevibacterium sp. UMB1308A TaxID=3050608 RepID=UPI00254AFE02|nr:orotate phosphoribosyltransferase [Brevibacterium sp. UMB1308A]MDK8346223.1 orotate phosphoribosyltransferase [Brevibacterium sp. UMB1308B]MDK8714504.1 orotate phosphoribosyltransferase [Brevibacterium sp. UMB1308A]